jgi:hypothetical protein
MQSRHSSNSHAGAMSEHAFAMLGVEDVAYIREVTVDGNKAWAIIGGDGTSLALAPNRELAFAAALQADRTPVSAH